MTMGDDIQMIVQGEKDIAAAHLSLDLDVLNRLYHPDFIIAQPDGTFENKTDVLASYGSGERHWTLAEVDQLTVKISGDSGVAFGRWRAIGTNKELHFNYAAKFCSVWVKTNHGWQNFAYQSCEIPFE